MKCKNCGAEGTGKYCSECGAPLEPEDFEQPLKPNSSTEYSDGFANADKTEYDNASYEGKTQNSNKKNGWKIAATLIIVLCVGVIVTAVIFGVAACNIIHGVKNAADSGAYDSAISSAKEQASQYAGEIESKINKFAENNNFLYSDSSDGKKLYGYYVKEENAPKTLEIPSEDDGSPVVEIGSFFSVASNHFTKVIIPDSVKIIDSDAFCQSVQLESATIGSGVTSIGKRAFLGCPKMKSITIPENVTKIDEKAVGYKFAEGKYKTEKIEGFVIYGKQGSAAQSYAEDNCFTFKQK